MHSFLPFADLLPCCDLRPLPRPPPPARHPQVTNNSLVQKTTTMDSTFCFLQHRRTALVVNVSSSRRSQQRRSGSIRGPKRQQQQQRRQRVERDGNVSAECGGGNRLKFSCLTSEIDCVAWYQRSRKDKLSTCHRLDHWVRLTRIKGSVNAKR